MIPILELAGLPAEKILNRDIQNTDPAIEAAVDAVLADVRENGDAALRKYAAKFNGVELDALTVTESELDAALASVDSAFLDTLRRAAENIRAFHEKQLHEDFTLNKPDGIVMGQRWTPIEKVGVCVPGSPETFPSTVLMDVIPAKIAGVKTVVMVTPPGKDGGISPEALAAAKIAGVDLVVKAGGAQGVAALAYGTESVPAVDKIVGPGGVFVATAKRKVFGRVDIDMIAGPSEILVLADGKCDPRWVAADLLSQAEHDVLASAVLVTDSRELAEAVREELEVQLAKLPRQEVARKSIDDNGKILIAADMAEAVAAVNAIAPEHLELCVEEPFELLKEIRNAGSVFLGRHVPEALGDYYGGPNHTLPTSGTARFSSPLGVDDFMKRSSFLYYPPEALAECAERVADFARREGLEAHARSMLIRTGGCE